MKELRGTASAVVAAPIEDCLALLVALDGYPSWYPDVVREVAVLERAGDVPSKARTKLHVAFGPLVRDFNLLLAISVEPSGTVRLTRIPHGPSDQEKFAVTWRLEEGGGTRIRLELDADLSVPRLLPLGGIGEAIAKGFVGAAARAVDARRG